MAVVDGLSSANVVRPVLVQSTYWTESCVDQNARSSSSDANWGGVFNTLFLRTLIGVPLFPGHVSSRDHSDEVLTNGEHHEEESARADRTVARSPSERRPHGVRGAG